jgi:hypothetical protein
VGDGEGEGGEEDGEERGGVHCGGNTGMLRGVWEGRQGTSCVVHCLSFKVRLETPPHLPSLSPLSVEWCSQRRHDVSGSLAINVLSHSATVATRDAASIGVSPYW